MLLAFFFLMVVGDVLALIFRIPEESVAAEWVFYGLYNLIIASIIGAQLGRKKAISGNQ